METKFYASDLTDYRELYGSSYWGHSPRSDPEVIRNRNIFAKDLQLKKYTRKRLPKPKCAQVGLNYLTPGWEKDPQVIGFYADTENWVRIDHFEKYTDYLNRQVLIFSTDVCEGRKYVPSPWVEIIPLYEPHMSTFCCFNFADNPISYYRFKTAKIVLPDQKYSRERMVDRLRENVEKLREHIDHSPDGLQFAETKEHFKTLSNRIMEI